MQSQFDREKAKRNIKEILEKMHNDTDISQMHEYHKLYKKEVSFFKRSWTAAWLLMYYDQKETPQARTCSEVSGGAEKPQPEVYLSEEESKRLFVSIGKNRRLYPKEIISLIMSKTSAAREDIGAIRILDNYSFVQVRNTKADEIIEKLTGHKFRGRTLTINFAKPKTSENEDSN